MLVAGSHALASIRHKRTFLRAALAVVFAPNYVGMAQQRGRQVLLWRVASALLPSIPAKS